MTTISAVATVAGIGALFVFNGTAGLETAGPGGWPEGTAVERSRTAPTVLVFAHPFCSCTGATLEELDGLLAKRNSGAQAPVIRILFSRSDPAWRPGELWSRASRIPGASPAWDEGGKEARIFGARTSGLVFLYDRRGKLLFRGGITSSRGHTGDSYGAERLTAALDSGQSAVGAPSKVFGCALFATSDDRVRER
jgi:hypothetical protein